MAPNRVILKAFVLFASLSLGLLQQVPTLTCKKEEPPMTVCLLEDISLPRSAERYNIFTEVPENITIVRVKDSKLPVVSVDFCETFPETFLFNGAGNEVEVVAPRAFATCKKLFYLDLQNNSITTLPANLFEGTLVLNILHLEHNLLTDLPRGIFANTDLGNVNLDNNFFTEVPVEALTGLPDFIGLAMKSNEIVRMDADYISSSLENLSAISFNDNLLPCGKVEEILLTFNASDIYVNKFILHPKNRTIVTSEVEGIQCVE